MITCAIYIPPFIPPGIGIGVGGLLLLLLLLESEALMILTFGKGPVSVEEELLFLFDLSAMLSSLRITGLRGRGCGGIGGCCDGIGIVGGVGGC